RPLGEGDLFAGRPGGDHRADDGTEDASDHTPLAPLADAPADDRTGRGAAADGGRITAGLAAARLHERGFDGHRRAVRQHQVGEMDAELRLAAELLRRYRLGDLAHHFRVSRNRDDAVLGPYVAHDASAEDVTFVAGLAGDRAQDLDAHHRAGRNG